MATQNATSVPSKRLAISILSSDTSMVLNNILSWVGMVDGTTQLTSADFGTRAFAVLRNATNTQMELVEFDPTTIANYAVTIISRGLSYRGGTVANAVTAYNWNANETIVELGSHTPQLFEQYIDKTSDETIAGIKTFSSLPATTAGNAVAANDLVRKAQLDAASNSTTNNYVVIAGTAGETLVAGNIVYLKTADNRWWKASSAAAATAENVILGIAQGAGATAGAIASGVLLYGLDSNQSGLTANTLYYLSTGGAMATSGGTKVIQLGYSTSTTAIFFFPNFDRLLTKDQQLALAGDSGTPGSANKLVTQAGLQTGAEVYAATATGNDTYVITLSPVLAAYANGQRFRFKVDVGNTGAASLNINSLGAITLVTSVGTALVTGDIVANQIVEVVYNSTGPVFQVLNPASMVVLTPAYKSGTITRDLTAAGGAVTTAHGLGVIPKYIRITGFHYVGGATLDSVGVYNGTTTSSIQRAFEGATGSTLTDSTNIIKIGEDGGDFTANQAAVATFDATNITLTWTKTGSPTGTASILWEAYS